MGEEPYIIMTFINSKFREYGADASLLFISIIWGSTFIITKQAIENVPVFSFLSLRFAVASVLLLIICFPRIKHITFQTILDGTILGSVLFLTYAFQTVGLKYTQASVTAFITGLYVVIVPVLSLIILKKKPRSYAVIGVLLAFSGLALITLNGRIVLSRGEVLVLVNAVFASFHIVFTDFYSRRNDIFLLTAVQILVVLIYSILSSVLFEKDSFSYTYSNQFVFAIFLTGVLATVVAFLIQTGLQKCTTPTKAAIIFSMEPVSSAFFSYFIGAELLTLRQYTGAMIIIFAVLFVEAGSYYDTRSKIK